MVWALLVVIVGVVASAGAGTALAVGQRGVAQREVQRRAALVVAAASGEVGRYVDAVRTMAAAVGAFDHLTAVKFSQVTEPVAGMRLAGAVSVVYLVPTDSSGVAATQALWRQRGASGLVLHPAAGVNQHVFAVLTRRLDQAAPKPSGRDIASSAIPAQTLATARTSGRTAVSDPYLLRIDRTLPANQQQLSFLLTAPVYGRPDTSGRRPFTGWILMALRAKDFLNATLSQVSQGLLDVTLTADHTSTEAGAVSRAAVTVAALRATVRGHRDLTTTGQVPVGDRVWQLSVDAKGLALPGAQTRLPTVVTLAGSLLGLLLAGLVFVLATGRARAQATVDTATADLAATVNQLRKHEKDLDTTIGQLRDREADLKAFAGVVAHDLKSPLATIVGYAEVLDDGLATGGDPAALRPTTTRVLAGAERMRRLIDDLLAYATARDGRLDLQPVDLDQLVAHVVAERTADLRATTARSPAGTTSASAQFPDIYTGPLPVVWADPAMIRQLMDNLIGNALKYTLPGQPAHIDISAHHRAGDSGQARIVIADRGIGIPAAEQPHVFTSFHRAAAHSRDYTGTGLGLAICQRIIDRHGGHIGVSDNPGGGTQIWFTLPTTDPATPVPTVGQDQRPIDATTTSGPSALLQPRDGGQD